MSAGRKTPHDAPGQHSTRAFLVAAALALALFSLGCEGRARITSARASEPVNICPGDEVVITAFISNFRSFRVTQNGATLEFFTLPLAPPGSRQPAPLVRDDFERRFRPVVDTTYGIDASVAFNLGDLSSSGGPRSQVIDESFRAFRDVVLENEGRDLNFELGQRCTDGALARPVDLLNNDRGAPTNTWSDRVRVTSVAVIPSPAFTSHTLTHTDRERTASVSLRPGEESRAFEGMLVPGPWTLSSTLSEQARAACNMPLPTCPQETYLCTIEYPPGYPPYSVRAVVKLACR